MVGYFLSDACYLIYFDSVISLFPRKMPIFWGLNSNHDSRTCHRLVHLHSDCKKALFLWATLIQASSWCTLCCRSVGHPHQRSARLNIRNNTQLVNCCCLYGGAGTKYQIVNSRRMDLGLHQIHFHQRPDLSSWAHSWILAFSISQFCLTIFFFPLGFNCLGKVP